MKNANRTLAVVSLSAFLINANGLMAQDWPQWRGANRDAKATGFQPPSTWPKELTQKWKVTVGQGDATPSLVGDKLYVFARQESSEVIRCLDAATGKELWQEKYDSLGATGPASGHSGPRSSPTVTEGKVLTLGVRGILSCLDAATGKVVWRKDDFQGAWPRFFAASSPIVVDAMCIAQLGGQNNGGIVAYDLATGNEKWKWTGESPAYASPVLMTVGGAKVIIAQTEKSLMAVGVSNGKSLWQIAFAPQGMGYNASTPIVDGQTLIYAGQGRGIRAVKLEKEGDGMVAKDVWSNSEQSPQFNSLVLKSGLLFGLSQGNQFFCVNAQTGKSVWTAAGPQAAGGGGRGGRGGGYGSIVDAGSVLMALTPTSELIVLQPSEKEYSEVAKIKVADSPTYAHLVVSGNRLFVKDAESVTLWAVN
ncbi:MAG: PQQ-like beta-propeller repeat protein [Verrucomicrobia bacterium]|nr:PQQ-like beta-propeller repeat protein [Verrucomicrobiota bacterium]